ncbi:GtrA family protein [Yinghuangia sp. YIM S09857]|uniref:GtrA family protein n=1 Tax=Yinghuangia sp. YIM S09857 TaxID=3436929 RepID=UPI003F530B43
MTNASAAAKAAATARGPVAAFIRFVVCGGGVTLAASGLLVLMTGLMPFFAANAVVTVVSTVVTTELHARVTFRSAERGWGVHLKSAGTVAVGFLVTTAAMAVLHMLAATPGILVEQAVYLSACGLAGIGRFVVLRVVVFAGRNAVGPTPREAAVIAADLPRASVVVAA